ncbi:RsfA family transcriptional regulator [Aquibacillus salsiterrae]|uniref:RsfA family transcriptional regulator n=1 Tax=Aquibacillus salsiterrae TaxID=2950439 RepID=A0A9X3WAJ3_9BACI|nr:RsfA family transcriptional regulator [Aquibacillus salsiterrae]MDC3415625.1 RsfA family transcriptional regulator [Aquibacillus salsiterrae]
MVKVRQDAWSHEDDLLLAETVLRHIREGSTQLNAFEEVGDKLNRTSAACGFRWNAEVRQKYEQAVAIAKRQRKEKKRAQAREEKAEQKHTPQKSAINVNKETIPATNWSMLNEEVLETESNNQVSQPITQDASINLDMVIDYLSSIKQEYYASANSQTNLEKLKVENAELIKEKESLEKKNSQLQEQLQTIQEDYQVLIQIMDRARKMVVFDDDESVSTPAFRMEKNGNLEQVAR